MREEKEPSLYSISKKKLESLSTSRKQKKARQAVIRVSINFIIQFIYKFPLLIPFPYLTLISSYFFSRCCLRTGRWTTKGRVAVTVRLSSTHFPSRPHDNPPETRPFASRVASTSMSRGYRTQRAPDAISSQRLP